MDSSVALQRLLWIESELHNGRCITMSMSYNHQNGTEKIRFSLAEFGIRSVKPCINSAIQSIKDIMKSAIVIDKGHTSRSRNKSFAEFWIKHRISNMVNTENVAATVVDDSDQDNMGDGDPSLLNIPPVPPPPLDYSETMTSYQELNLRTELDTDICNKLQHVEQLCLHANTNMHLLYPMQSALEALPKRVEQAVSSVAMAMNEKLDTSINTSRRALHRSFNINTAADNTSSLQTVQARYQLAEGCTQVTAEPSMLHVSSRSVSTVGTQVTARMIEDALEDTIMQDTEMADLSPAPSEDVEEVLEIPKIEFKRNELYRRKVHIAEDDVTTFGRIIGMSFGVRSQQYYYRVRFDDGKEDDLTREEVEAILL